MVQPVKVRLARTARQLIEAKRYIAFFFRERACFEPEGRITKKLSISVQFMLRDLHQQLLKAVEVRPGRLVADSELLADFIVKVLQQFAPRGSHGLIDL